MATAVCPVRTPCGLSVQRLWALIMPGSVFHCSLFLELLKVSVCLCVLVCTCMFVCTTCMQCQCGPEESIASSGTGIIARCELPCGFWELNLGPFNSNTCSLARPPLQPLCAPLHCCPVWEVDINSGSRETNIILSVHLVYLKTACAFVLA